MDKDLINIAIKIQPTGIDQNKGISMASFVKIYLKKIRVPNQFYQPEEKDLSKGSLVPNAPIIKSREACLTK